MANKKLCPQSYSTLKASSHLNFLPLSLLTPFGFFLPLQRKCRESRLNFSGHGPYSLNSIQNYLECTCSAVQWRFWDAPVQTTKFAPFYPQFDDNFHILTDLYVGKRGNINISYTKREKCWKVLVNTAHHTVIHCMNNITHSVTFITRMASIQWI